MESIKNKMEFEDVYFDKTMKLYVVSLMIDGNTFDYYMDIDYDEHYVDYSDYCRYRGECNTRSVKEYTFKVKITKLYQVQIFNENGITELNKEMQEEAVNFVNEYFEEFPEVYKEAYYI
jgi:hypothetical protein